VILVDSNVPMYLVGTPHRHKADAQRLVEAAISSRERLVTDVEVLQEILHRYAAIDRPEAIQPAFDVLLGVVEVVFPVELPDVQRAREVVLGGYGLSARDALHVAVMERQGVERILSFDTAFDRYPGVTRIA